MRADILFPRCAKPINEFQPAPPAANFNFWRRKVTSKWSDRIDFVAVVFMDEPLPDPAG
jgi:hypothetical protein